MKKRLVVVCDDQVRFLDQFYQRHCQHYTIVRVNDTRELPGVIDPKHLPDLVLLDLYHPRDDDTDYENRRLAAEASLTKLDEQLEETNQAVLTAWEPRGLEVLELLRQEYSPQQLPIAIHTQKGLLLLDDSQLRGVEEHGAHWLLKDRLSARTEEIRIDRIIMSDREHPRRAAHDLFISYATGDAAIAEELRGELEQQGLMCFMAGKDIEVAGNWQDAVREALLGSDRVLVLLTPRSMTRPWVLMETGAAWALGKPLIAALIHVNPSDLIDPIRRHQARVIETTAQRNALVEELANT